MLEPRDSPSFNALRGLLGPFAARLVTDVLLDALPTHWENRARDLEAARPRASDYIGGATPADRARRDRELAEAAAACRERAEFLRRYPDVMADEVFVAVAQELERAGVTESSTTIIAAAPSGAR